MSRGPSNYDLQADLARKLFLTYDQTGLIRKYDLRSDDRWIYMDYLNIPSRIGRADGRIWQRRGDQWVECRDFSTVMTVYDLLCHHRGEQAPKCTGQWCAVGHFVVTGVTDTGAFTKKYAARFDGRLEEVKAACAALGGVAHKSVAGADITCIFPVTPWFPVMLQFWASDEEFPAALKLLWDRASMDFLHFETTFYLQGDLLERLWEQLGA